MMSNLQKIRITRKLYFQLHLNIRNLNLNFLDQVKKIKKARNSGFMFDQRKNLAKKLYSSLPNMNIHYYLKFPIPIMHRQFFRILSQNPK